MPKPIPKAIWNPETDRWEKKEGTIFGHSDVYSETLPKSGMTVGGQLFELPTLVPRITGSECSSSPHYPTPQASDWKRDNYPADNRRKSPNITAVDTHFPTPTASDSTGGGNAPEPPSGQVEATDRHGSNFRWGEYEPVVRRWESIFRPAPDPVEPGRNGRARLNAEFAEWMMGLPEGHVTSVDIPRSTQLKALGNGVVPSQCAAALTYLLEVPEFHDLNSASNAT